MNLDAPLRFHTAIDQLTQPEHVRLDRYRPEADPDTAAQLAELTEQSTRHRAAHAAAARRRDHPGMRRALARLVASEGAVRAITVPTGTVPPLYDQLVDAVESSTSSGGAPGLGASRAPITLEAAELLGHIRLHTGAATTAALAAWARVTVADDVVAEVAERWVAAAREIVSPARGFEARAACPRCRTRYVRQAGPDGTTTMRAAIQVNYASRSARCIAPGCTGYWDRDHLPLLASVLECDTPGAPPRTRSA